MKECDGEDIEVICADCFIAIMRKADEALEKMKGDRENGRNKGENSRKNGNGKC